MLNLLSNVGKVAKIGGLIANAVVVTTEIATHLSNGKKKSVKQVEKIAKESENNGSSTETKTAG